jgi:hypothetical protein
MSDPSPATDSTCDPSPPLAGGAVSSGSPFTPSGKPQGPASLTAGLVETSRGLIEIVGRHPWLPPDRITGILTQAVLLLDDSRACANVSQTGPIGPVLGDADIHLPYDVKEVEEFLLQVRAVSPGPWTAGVLSDAITARDVGDPERPAFPSLAQAAAAAFRAPVSEIDPKKIGYLLRSASKHDRFNGCRVLAIGRTIHGVSWKIE